TPGVGGLPGEDGLAGESGTPGTPGTDGAPGAPGTDGSDGRDGRDGAPGPRPTSAEFVRDGDGRCTYVTAYDDGTVVTAPAGDAACAPLTTPSALSLWQIPLALRTVR
ncbi:MAG: hypothetical protein ACRCZP_00380, partial [Phycicoccus sp.]